MPTNPALNCIVGMLLLAVVTSGCKTGNMAKTTTCPKMETAALMRHLNASSSVPLTAYSSKIAVRIKRGRSSNSFKTTVKIQADSAFSGIVKVAGIVAAAYLADRDTFTFTHKIKKCYFKEGYEQLSQRWGVAVSYALLEALLLGKPLALQAVEQWYPLRNDRYHVLSSHDKRAVRRLQNDQLTAGERQDFFVQYQFDCQSTQLVHTLVDVPSLSTAIRLNYTERQVVDGVDLPAETTIHIHSPEDTTSIELSYSATALNRPKRIGIHIPTTYHACE